MMSFRDELSNALPTPEQQREKSIHSGQLSARYDYSKIKDYILSRAKSGNYILDQDGKKFISFRYPDSFYGEPEVAEYIKRVEKQHTTTSYGGFFGNKKIVETSYETSYVVTDQIAYDAYMEELSRISQEDDISIHLIGYNKAEIRKQQVSIPGYVGTSEISGWYQYRIKLDVSIRL